MLLRSFFSTTSSYAGNFVAFRGAKVRHVESAILVRQVVEVTVAVEAAELVAGHGAAGQVMPVQHRGVSQRLMGSQRHPVHRQEVPGDVFPSHGVGCTQVGSVKCVS